MSGMPLFLPFQTMAALRDPEGRRLYLFYIVTYLCSVRRTAPGPA